MSDLVQLLDDTATSLENDGLSADAAALTALQFNIHGLCDSLISLGQTGADLTNNQLGALVSGLLDTLAWISARTMAKQAWDEVGDGPIFPDDI